MSDQVTNDYLSDGAEAGQPLEQAQDSQPTYVTPAELEARIADALEQAKRFAQSKTDQASTRITKALKEQEQRLQDRVTALKAAGANITDSMVEAQRQKIIERVLSEESDGEEDEQPAQAAPPVDYRMQARALAAQSRVSEMIAEAGFAIDKNDPELRNVQANAPTPEQWEQSYKAALQRKAQRLGKTLDLGEDATPAAARVPGGAGSGAGGSPATLEANSRQLEKLLVDPIKNRKEIERLIGENDKLLKQQRR